MPKGIAFGAPSSRSATSPTVTSSGSKWASQLGWASGGLGALASGVLGGLGFGQLLTGALQKWGGGSDSKTLMPLTRFSLPNSKQLTSTIARVPPTLAVPTAASPRPSFDAAVHSAVSSTQPQVKGISQGTSSQPLAGSGSSTGTGHQVHVHVSALDTQSFMDRSNDIAKAVKSALLQSNSLNDVISEI
jgi:hypothetical protein